MLDNQQKRGRGRPRLADVVKYDYNKIYEDFKNGKTDSAIAKEYGVTASRIQSIRRNKLKLTPAHGEIGGHAVIAEINKKAAEIKRLIQIDNQAAKYGFATIEEYQAHIAQYGRGIGSPIEKYRCHKHANNHRNYRMTFAEWWKMWQDSGVWDHRGRCKYAMRLIDDSKPFQVGNVEIYYIPGNSLHGIGKYKDQLKNSTLMDDYLQELKKA